MEKENREKVLIIKTGYSEFLFNEENSGKTSYGDILRITPLLHLFKDDHVVWLTDPSAFPLLEGNPYITRLLPLDFTNSMHILDEDFDTVINLEKNHDVCKFANRINAWIKYGFRFDYRLQKPHAFDRASDVLTYSSDINIKKDTKKTVQELLFELVGHKWNGEEYILGYKPKSEEVYDIGLNTIVGGKWPIKAWPAEHWDKLESDLIKQGRSVSRQDKQPKEVLTSLYSYMDWINSCKMLITNDSLGLHLAIAMKKKVLGLFGPTTHTEVHFYGRGKAILPKLSKNCMPCFKDSCETGLNCMREISPEQVLNEVNMLN